MAPRKKTAKKSGKKKAKKKRSAPTRSNPDDADTATEPAVDVDEFPPESPADEPPPATIPLGIDPGPNMISVADLLHVLPNDALKQLVESDRVQELIGADLDEQERQQKQIDEFFAQIYGLDEKVRHQCIFQVWRSKPLFHKGVRTEGLCDNFHPPFELTDIAERFGGGTYEITLYLPGENRSQQLPKAQRRTATVPIVGEPKVYTLQRDVDGKGVQLDPKIQSGIESMQKELADLKTSLADREPKESFADSLLKDLAPLLMERFMNPPAPPELPPPPAAPTFTERLAELQALSTWVSTLQPPPAGDAPAADGDDDSALADIKRNMENATQIADLATKFFEQTGIKKPKAAAGISPEEAKRQEDESLGLLATFVDTTWVYLMSDNSADQTADALKAFVDEHVPDQYIGWIRKQLTLDYVTNFLRQRAGKDENRLKRLDSDRGKNMVASVLEKLHAKMKESA